MLKSIIGKPTINPVLFFAGKSAGYLLWILFIVGQFTSIQHIGLGAPAALASILIYFAGLLVAIVSMVNLGDSTTLGLPEHETKFKNSGLYRISRNPMYLGFSMMTIGSVLSVFNIATILLAILSLYTYHLVIKSEEKYLLGRFGEVYRDYCKTVRRYL